MPILPGSSSSSPGLGLTSIAFPMDMPLYPASRRLTIRQLGAVAVAQSPFTGARQVQEWPADRWGFDVELPPMKEYDARVWFAWFAALRGQYGSFLIGDRTQVLPRGAWSTMTPLVDGAAQSGRTLAVKGLSASIANVARSGDYLQVGSGATSRMHMVLMDASSDGAGKATLAIWPPLRESPANSAAIVVNGAKCVASLTSSQRDMTIDEAMVAGIKFSAEEVL